jgi:hypothetical protein
MKNVDNENEYKKFPHLRGEEIPVCPHVVEVHFVSYFIHYFGASANCEKRILVS